MKKTTLIQPDKELKAFAKNVNEIPTLVDVNVKKAKNFSVSDAW